MKLHPNFSLSPPLYHSLIPIFLNWRENYKFLKKCPSFPFYLICFSMADFYGRRPFSSSPCLLFQPSFEPPRTPPRSSSPRKSSSSSSSLPSPLPSSSSSSLSSPGSESHHHDPWIYCWSSLARAFLSIGNKCKSTCTFSNCS